MTEINPSNNASVLYPLKFRPNFHPALWGGRRLQTFKGQISMGDVIGESWEISVVPHSVSVVSGGLFDGRFLTDLICEFGPRILGKSVYSRYGSQFPLLIKFIDAQKDLSIQVHPDDEMAMRLAGTMGKTEMWYVIDSAPGAKLISGLNRNMTKEEFLNEAKDGSILRSLTSHNVGSGDVFFIPAGRVHAIGGGLLVAEIQQNSNITYRVNDYGRIGLDGRPRELHVELASEAADLKKYDDYKTHYDIVRNVSVDLVKCSCFTTRILEADTECNINVNIEKSFVVVVCVAGRCFITDGRGYKVSVKVGECCLLPADSGMCKLRPMGSCKVLLSEC